MPYVESKKAYCYDIQFSQYDKHSFRKVVLELPLPDKS